MVKYFMANPTTGNPIALLAEYQGTSNAVKYFDSEQEAQFFAESIEYPSYMFVIKKAE